MNVVLAHITGNGWDDWAIVAGPVLIFAVIAAALARPRGTDRSPLAAAAHGLERITGVTGWAAGAVGTGLGGLTIAAIGFYWDVAWHIDLGRDTVLFTPPHTLILLGLGAILLAGGIGVALASATGVDTRIRVGPLRVPWSALALLAIGGGAVMGFPLDEMWHRAYGIDVTMWGPTHLIMIGGASITGIALWLALGEAGARPVRKTFGYRMHVIVAGAVLTGLSALQGEFDFGVPQFQLLYHPVLVMLAAGAALTAARIVFGRGGALRAAVGFIAIRGVIALFVGGFGHTVPHFPLYLAPALAVEAAAWLAGTERLGRFALASGAGVATIGLAGEWGWSHVWMPHPWTASLLPAALWIGALAALGGAVLGAALGAVASGRPVEPVIGTEPRRAVAAGLVAATLGVALALALPIQRVGSDVTAEVKLEPTGGLAAVEVRLAPPDAARDARWFEVMSWQGGGLTIEPLHLVTAGVYRTARPVPIDGKAKTLVRLHRGGEMVAVPVRFPADPEIGAGEIPAVDRTARFERDSKLLMREAHGGSPTAARIIFAILAAIVAVWVAVLALGATRIARRKEPPGVAASTRYEAA